MFMFLPFMIMFSLMFLTMNHPLTCGLILLMQTIFTSMISGLMNFNYWYSYILFLIMVGGMLILFIYMTSIASNEKFKFNPMLLLIMLLFILITMSLMIIDSFYSNLFNQMYEMKSYSLSFFNNLSMMKYFNTPNYLMMLLMIIYLFITLIVVVKVTNFLYGPLRQKF